MRSGGFGTKVWTLRGPGHAVLARRHARARQQEGSGTVRQLAAPGVVCGLVRRAKRALLGMLVGRGAAACRGGGGCPAGYGRAHWRPQHAGLATCALARALTRGECFCTSFCVWASVLASTFGLGASYRGHGTLSLRGLGAREAGTKHLQSRIRDNTCLPFQKGFRYIPSAVLSCLPFITCCVHRYPSSLNA